MKTIGMTCVLLAGLGAAGCGGGSGAGSNPGTAGSSGSAGVTGASGTTGTAGTTGAAGVTGSQGSCGTVQPCGGAIVGTWKAASACILDSSLYGANDIKDTCATAELVATGFSIAGSATYNADKTYATEGTFTLDLKLTLPLSCFGPGKNCAGLQAVYVQQGVFDNPTCSVQGLACVCSLVSTQDTTDSGTYSTSGTTMTTTGADGMPSVDQYCVKGNELHSIGVDMTMPMGPMGMARIQGDLVFTKQ